MTGAVLPCTTCGACRHGLFQRGQRQRRFCRCLLHGLLSRLLVRPPLVVGDVDTRSIRRSARSGIRSLGHEEQVDGYSTRLDKKPIPANGVQRKAPVIHGETGFNAGRHARGEAVSPNQKMRFSSVSRTGPGFRCADYDAMCGGQEARFSLYDASRRPRALLRESH